MSVVDDYFHSLDEPTRATFEHVRGLAMGLVPEAEDGKSYGMVALRYRGKPLLGFLATKDHLSVFPFSPRVVESVRDRLAGFALSKGTIRFGAACPTRSCATSSGYGSTRSSAPSADSDGAGRRDG